MRVRSIVDIQTLIRQSEMVSIESMLSRSEDEDGGGALDQYLIAPEPGGTEDVNDIASSDIFKKLTPGEELTVLILRAEGYTLNNISKIMGLPEEQVKSIVSTARKKLAPLLKRSG